ncbi:MAG: M48 family metallopeptidase [Bacteroidetes bacterium]|nr:M48 family metallopeptidase [Bacteroidota bacterium]
MEKFSIKKYILLCFLCISASMYSQVVDFNHYQNVECNGEIPKVIIKTIEKRILEEEKKEISKKDNWREKKTKEKFIVESSYGISELLLSGSVLFNDSMSTYITSVAKELLKSDPETFSKLHFFAVKSAYINAFSTNEGIILINIGLLSQLETEAQLAFVLAHEIAHFKKKHVLNSYIELEGNPSRSNYSSKKEQENILRRENYSKEAEIEADEVGYEILRESSYSLESVSGVFDILQYSFQPTQQIPFDPSFFNSTHLQIPSSYFLKKVNEIQRHDDASGTHPNVSTRRNNILSKGFFNTADKNDFIHSPAQFEFIRDIARFELISVYIAERKYEIAIYNAYALLQKYPESEFLYTAIGNALYFLAKYDNVGIVSDVTSSYINVQGEAQQIHFFIQSLTKADLNVIACEFLWRQYFKYPYRQDMKKKGDEILNELIRLYYPNGNDFSDKVEDAQPTLNTIDTLLAKKKTVPQKEIINTRYAFVDLLKNPEFNFAYYQSFVHKDQNVTISKKYYSEELVQYNPREFKHLHIQKLVMVDPAYYKINNVFSNNSFDPVNSEKARKAYSAMIKEVDKKAKLDVVLLDSKFLSAKQVSVFNEISRLNAFINELYIHKSLDSMLSTDYQLTQLLLQKHNTKYLAWNSIVALVEADAMADPYLFTMYSYYMPPLIPIFLFDALTPDYYTYHTMLAADIEKGKIIFNNSYKIIGKDSPDRLKSNLYYNFLQLGGKKKK